MTAAIEELLDEFGTGLQRTEVRGRPGGPIRWLRMPGPDAVERYRAVSPEVVAQLKAASDGRLQFAVPELTRPELCVWAAPGTQSLAKLMSPELADPDSTLAALLDRLGARLRVLHERPVPGPLSNRRGPARFSTWLERGGGTRAAGPFGHLLRSRLGPARWRKLADLAAAQRGGDALLHGWVSLGSLVVGDGGYGALLSGLEVARGRAETDLGCLVGELVEYAGAAGRRGIDWPLLGVFRDAFLAGYGPGWDPDRLAAAALLRVACHAHDFASYVGWGAQLHGYVPMLADLLDSDGAAALPGR